MRSKILSAAALALLASACSAAGTNQAVPLANTGSGIADVNGGGQVASGIQPDADATSVLKTLATQTVIGSTVDPSNGDKAPYGLTYISQPPYFPGKIKKGDLVACNFADTTGALGNGTTEEILTAKKGSKPVQFVQSASIKGCAGLGTDEVYGDVF